MTPLAQHIVKQMLEPASKRTFRDDGGVFGKMADVHCFECTDVWEMAGELGRDAIRRGIDLAASSFLPAPKTWIEIREDGSKVAILLEEKSGFPLMVSIADSHRSLHWGWMRVDSRLCDISATILDGQNARSLFNHIYGLLAIINTPRVIGRKQHMPHRGLERRLLRERGKVGLFPLQGWTELKLEAFYQKREPDGKVHEAHLTGEVCRHFCRAHMRIRLGRVEFVSSSWKGNEALGVKQTRYRVTPPRRRAA